jgi:SAM-dependent methyltransferase
MAVLDAGCGTGAITAGIANAVGPQGYVMGIDRDQALLEVARSEHATVPNLHFERGDATTLNLRARFDVVTAARTLQWIAEPALAVANLKKAAKPTGVVVVLDYNHLRNQWQPDPPRDFQRFYDAFLAWRQSNRWDNEMADHLPELFRSAGLTNIESRVQDEISGRGDADFTDRTALWSEVIESLGGQLEAGGFCTGTELQAARERYASWAKTDLIQQTLAMRAVIGMAT